MKYLTITCFTIYFIQEVASYNIRDEIELKKFYLMQRRWDLHTPMTSVTTDVGIYERINRIFKDAQEGIRIYGHSEEGEICFEFNSCADHHLDENVRLIKEGNFIIDKVLDELDDLLKSSDDDFVEFLFSELTKGSYHDAIEALDKIMGKLTVNSKEYLHCHTTYEYKKEEYEIRKLKEYYDLYYIL